MATPPSSSGSTAALPYTPPVPAPTAIYTLSSTVNSVTGWSTGATTGVLLFLELDRNVLALQPAEVKSPERVLVCLRSVKKAYALAVSLWRISI